MATPLYVGPTGARLSGGLASGRAFFPWAELGVGATLPRTVLGGEPSVSLTWLTARPARREEELAGRRGSIGVRAHAA
ncbi:hypothetical protein [Sorangium cellulosum]|uniref:hypothetical protein n=1 Tax=Sorangium cellulosum TaxID=56 RepID=UPI0012DB416F|nr:hypothetical protein [Sorangium cellulosum]